MNITKTVWRMKYPESLYNDVLGYAKTLLSKVFNIGNPALIEWNMREAYALYNHVYMNLAYTDDNPNVKKDKQGNRVLPHIPDFDYYPTVNGECLCDKHIETMLKQFIKDIVK